ncbi:MAG: hypothetical protein HGA31_02195 [Candidatus Moranbacteria bacterium]|nr:hypothetical protein [Candidatus Moranbacteria bacterium]
MRRSEKMERYLKDHPGASVKRLQDKFRLDYKEAKEYHSRFKGGAERLSRQEVVACSCR